MTDKGGDTYYSRAIAEAETQGAGHFKKLTTTTVIGRDAAQYPEQPSGSPWAADPVPAEAPLGVDVNAVPNCGGPPVAPVGLDHPAVETQRDPPHFSLMRRLR
jgi:hypothetical protein